MAIDRSVVEKAAGLARIALTPEEVERFTGQLSVVLTAVERLKDVDTEKVSATASVLPVSNVMREDEIRPGLSRDEALANAPKGGRDRDAALDTGGGRAVAHPQDQRAGACRARARAVARGPLQRVAAPLR